MKQIQIYSDGSCLGNPGPGGCTAILKYKKYKKIITSGFFLTTNNRMELMAAILALKAIKEKCNIDFYTDSNYLYKGILKWIYDWKNNKWKKNNKIIKNIDLWKKLYFLIQLHKIKWFLLKSHTGNLYNEKCDIIAKKSAKLPTLNDIGYNKIK
ncbi:ribonuclease HI [Buchnera aphidicola (Neophyllaphis podocarpi)]|uniref:ribonuclease HI n=1 Tax=Buchnera aphidicola TaxID=9 RepID=UPI0031B8369F